MQTKVAKDHMPTCAEGAPCCLALQTQSPWEAEEQTYFSFFWLIVMLRKSCLLYFGLKCVTAINGRWFYGLPVAGYPLAGHPCCHLAHGSPSLQGSDQLRIPCPLSMDPPGSKIFLCTVMICCKFTLLCYSFLSLQNHASAVISSVLPNNWNKELFRLLSLQNNNCQFICFCTGPSNPYMMRWRAKFFFIDSNTTVSFFGLLY